MESLLQNRIAIITGASQGLGFEIAKKYIQAGASIAICARNETLLEQAKTQLQSYLGPAQQILALTADVSKINDAESVVRVAKENFGRIDILVNNAGVYGPKGFIEIVDWQD